MDKQQVIDELEKFKERLRTDVLESQYQDQNLGNQRWESWLRSIKKFLELSLPNTYPLLETKVNRPVVGVVIGSSYIDRFNERKFNPAKYFIDSLIIDIQNNEIDFNSETEEQFINNQVSEIKDLSNKAFIVHGHDEAAKQRTARFLEKLGFQAIILHEQASGGQTIIEKLEKYIDVGFGIVLYTPDDVGEAKVNKDNLKPRARQNVVFEHGLLIGKLGRERVFPLVTDHSIELPNDISGMVYMSDRNWEVDLAREIKALGYNVDLNILL